MAIKVECAKCGGNFSAAPEHAGKTSKCPRCQASLKIEAKPGPAAASASAQPASHRVVTNPEQLITEIRSAFRGTIEPVHTALTYKLGVVLIALLMLLLPAIYMAIIGLVGYGVYFHVMHSTALLERPGYATLALYVAPIIMGSTLIFFMVKPFFARQASDNATRSLTRDGEPILFEFVDAICAAVGSRAPRRIDVDSNVNASASFRSGLRSLFSRDLVLTIGVPLVAGLSTRQFAGVLAHEFGHFSQGAGMRLSYLIRRINLWFQRVVYQRDEWDEWLEKTAQDTDWRISIFLYATMLCIWLTRKILWALMMLGHLASSWFTREMEFDADRYEARLAGSDHFESTQLRVVTLDIAQGNAMQELQMIYREGKLADNLPKYIMAAANDFTSEQHAKIREQVLKVKTGWFDTHPSSQQRIQSAQREQSPGIFHLERPATQLFSNFDQLAKNVTWDVYRGYFGNKFERSGMHDTDALLASRQKHRASDSAADTYFQGCFTLLRRLQLPSAEPSAPAQPRQALERLKQARETFLAERDRYLQMFKEYDAADSQLLELKQVHELLYANISLKAKDYKVPVASTTAVARAREDAQTVQGRLDDKLKVCETAIGERLHLALQLWFVPQVTDRLKDAEQGRKEILRCYEALVHMLPHLTALTQLRNEFAALNALCQRLQRRNSEVLIGAIGTSLGEVSRQLSELRGELLRIEYPFEHTDPEMSVGRYCVPQPPLRNDLGATLQATGELLQSFAMLYRRITSRLVTAAEQVETIVGLPKLEMPAEALK